MSLVDHPLDRFFDVGGVLHVAPDGQMQADVSASVKVLLPGSFNPVHRGHWELARIAEQILGDAVSFELSVANVDKPALTQTEIRNRLAQFEGQAHVWLTLAPRFVQKAECFPGTTFLVGADTAVRIVAPCYYQNDEAAMLASLQRIADLNCRFLVACRADEKGKCWGVGDVAIPPRFRDLFDGIAPERFRWDISSTALRT
ncbi:MAG: hypothetical protein HYX68_14690 [Planctomycetes bacterium]|nr:hypothetical protein [Planctomycetota bacterium]